MTVTQQRHWIRQLYWPHVFLLAVVVLGLVAAILFSFVMWTIVDNPYLPFYPDISTAFAPDFTKEGYNQIQIGDTKERVLELIGQPVGSCEYDDGCVLTFWNYSYRNREAFFSEFAWINYQVQFDQNDQVVRTLEEIVHGDGS